MDAAAMKNTGGSAYPRNHVPGTVTTDGEGRQYHTPFMPAQEGMTLRDYFAAAALQGVLSDHVKMAVWGCENGSEGAREVAAMVAYEYADAMLAERDK